MASPSLAKSRAESGAAAPIDILELPINVIADRLNRAHATLDLIYTATASGTHDQAELFLEQLNDGTLDYALSSAMNLVDEARRANTPRAVARV